jgi:predicted ArsR family transcriptional regulator
MIEAQVLEQAAISALTAFGSRDTRTVFRKLIQADNEQNTAVDLASAAGISESAVTQHLDRLQQAGLLSSQHDGHAVGYAVDYHRTSELFGFLVAFGC